MKIREVVTSVLAPKVSVIPLLLATMLFLWGLYDVLGGLIGFHDNLIEYEQKTFELENSHVDALAGTLDIIGTLVENDRLILSRIKSLDENIDFIDSILRSNPEIHVRRTQTDETSFKLSLDSIKSALNSLENEQILIGTKGHMVDEQIAQMRTSFKGRENDRPWIMRELDNMKMIIYGILFAFLATLLGVISKSLYPRQTLSSQKSDE